MNIEVEKDFLEEILNAVLDYGVSNEYFRYSEIHCKICGVGGTDEEEVDDGNGISHKTFILKHKDECLIKRIHTTFGPIYKKP